MDIDDVQDLIERIRQKYIDQFVSKADELAAASKGPHTTEVKFANVDGFYRNFIAVDFVADDGKPEPHFINSETYLRFSPDIHLGIGDMRVSISPFKWDEAHLELDMATLDDEFFDEWFDSWFDVDEERATEDVVGNIVHGVQLLDGRMIVDFGTAEVDAFWHLLDTLKRSGVESVAIGTDDIAHHLN